MDVDAAAVELYGLPPEKFTAARNALVKAARDAGELNGSEAIKSLRKPTLAAWLANQLVRTEPDNVDDLTRLGEDLRHAHVSGDRARLRELTPRRFDLVQHLVKIARTTAREHGHEVSEQIAQRLTETLDAAVVDPGAAQLLRTGQLTSALRHVGFGVVDETGAPAQLAPVKPRVIRSTRSKQATKRPARPAKKAPSAAATSLQQRRAELESRVRDTEAEYSEAEAERAEAQAQLDAHSHLIADLDATIERLTEELEHTRQQLRDAHRRTRALEVELNRTTRNVAAAQRRRDANRQRLANFES
ncbi:hypothetical protein AB0F43_31300 [Kribbella sp. NPDC023972]|uniref:hypothetical protein n=1 Tax=Kribbella sp. NPDC023972 TaxID=3154795 RepID=UPI0033DEC31C